MYAYINTYPIDGLVTHTPPHHKQNKKNLYLRTKQNMKSTFTNLLVLLLIALVCANVGARKLISGDTQFKDEKFLGGGGNGDGLGLGLGGGTGLGGLGIGVGINAGAGLGLGGGSGGGGGLGGGGGGLLGGGGYNGGAGGLGGGGGFP